METRLFWIRVENTKTGTKHPSGFAPCDHETACRLLRKMPNGPDRRNFLEELDAREMELFDFDVEQALHRCDANLRALVWLSETAGRQTFREKPQKFSRQLRADHPKRAEV